MSTKIFTAYKLSEVNLLDVTSVIQTTGKEVTRTRSLMSNISKAVTRYESNKVLATDAYNIPSEDPEEKEHMTPGCSWIVNATFDTLMNTSKDEAIVFQATLCYDPETKIPYLTFSHPNFGSSSIEEDVYKAIKTKVEDMSGVEDFRYWNNSDKPDGVNEEQWEERAETWLRVLPPVPEPTWTLAIEEYFGMFTEDEYRSFIQDNPSVVSREWNKTSRAQRIALRSIMALGIQALEDTGDKKTNVPSVMKYLNSVNVLAPLVSAIEYELEETVDVLENIFAKPDLTPSNTLVDKGTVESVKAPLDKAKGALTSYLESLPAK